MRFTLERMSDPEIEVVTLAEMRQHLGEFSGNTAKDDAITALIVTAREEVEAYTGCALVDQSRRLSIIPGENDTGTMAYLMLRCSPVLAITSFVTVDASGDETAVDAATYELREAATKWPRIAMLDGTSLSAATQYRVTFRAGYADQTGSPQTGAEVVPDRFKIAIKLWAEALYDRDPATMDTLIKAAKNLLRHARVDVGFA